MSCSRKTREASLWVSSSTRVDIAASSSFLFFIIAKKQFEIAIMSMSMSWSECRQIKKGKHCLEGAHGVGEDGSNKALELPPVIDSSKFTRQGCNAGGGGGTVRPRAAPARLGQAPRRAWRPLLLISLSAVAVVPEPSLQVREAIRAVFRHGFLNDDAVLEHPPSERPAQRNAPQRVKAVSRAGFRGRP